MRKTGFPALQLGGPHPILVTGVVARLRPISVGPEAPAFVSGTPSTTSTDEKGRGRPLPPVRVD